MRAASVPVPRSTTPRNNSRSAAATSRETTRRTGSGRCRYRTVPGAPPSTLPPRTSRMRVGSSRTPSLASAPYAIATWIGVTESSYPMARLAALGRCHSEGGRSRPAASAGNSMPVGVPNPKSRSMAYCSSGSSRAANLTMPMLLETRIASAKVNEGCGSSSVIVRPGRRHLPPSPDTRSVGDTRRSVSRPAAAKILAMEPGSNVSVNALGRALPSRVRDARASTSPEVGSSITTSPPSASMRRRASSRARCAISCSSASKVSTTSRPGTGAAMTRAGDSYSRPARSLSTTAAPDRPASSVSSVFSSPEPPSSSSPSRPIVARATPGSG